jgi:hypothetical protein
MGLFGWVANDDMTGGAATGLSPARQNFPSLHVTQFAVVAQCDA